MENLSAYAIAGLALFWILMFRRILCCPKRFSTGESLSTFFPLWRMFGEQIRRRQIPHDPYGYCPSIWGLHFTSAWYPPQLISAWLGSFLSLDGSFTFYTVYSLLHYLFASIMAYLLFAPHGAPVALFGAFTLTYAQCYVRPATIQIYSVTWIPFVLWAINSSHPVLAAIGLFMIFAGGHPVAFFYTLPLFLGMSLAMKDATIFWVMATVLCLPPIIAMHRYIGRSIRTLDTYDLRAIGSLPLWHILSQPLILSKVNLNGVLYPETILGVGRLAIILGSFALWSPWGLLLLLCIYLMMGSYSKAPIPFKCASRAYYLWPIAWAYLAVYGLSSLHLEGRVTVVLLLLQCWDMIANHADVLLCNPFLEPCRKPSEWLRMPLAAYLKAKGATAVSGLPFPYFTGHLLGIRGLGYPGGCESLSHWKWIGSGNPQGSSTHDWFDHHSLEDSAPLTKAGYKFAYTSWGCPSGWNPTPIRNLYENPLVK